MPPLSSLPDELIEEILLRLPPNSPAGLVHAGLVCKRWCRLVSGAVFRRRFREFHRSPPMMGFLYDHRDDWGIGGQLALFVPTSASRQPHARLHRMRSRDSRHGRVLFQSYPLGTLTIVVWDPVTDELLELPKPPQFSLAMAVLCAASHIGGGCDHLDCHGRPFLVVLMCNKGDKVLSYVYSSEAGTWSNKPTSEAWLHGRDPVSWRRSALVENQLYFVSATNKRIIEYDLDTRKISVIDLPAANKADMYPALVELTTTEGGRLGFAMVENFKLCLWSREVEDARWVLSKVIDLGDLLPMGGTSLPYLVGSAEGVGVVFLNVKGGLFTVDLRSKQMTKVYADLHIAMVIPYVNFYTPVLRVPSTENGPSTTVVPLSGSTRLKPN